MSKAVNAVNDALVRLSQNQNFIFNKRALTVLNKYQIVFITVSISIKSEQVETKL